MAMTRLRAFMAWAALLGVLAAAHEDSYSSASVPGCTAPATGEEYVRTLTSTGVHLVTFTLLPGAARLWLKLDATRGPRPYARLRFGGVPGPPVEHGSPSSSDAMRASAPVLVTQDEAVIDWPSAGRWFVAVSYERGWEGFSQHQWIAPKDAGRYRLRILAASCGEALGGDCNCTLPIQEATLDAAAAVPAGPRPTLFRAWLPLDAPAFLSARLAPLAAGGFVLALGGPALGGAGPAAAEGEARLESPEGGRHHFFAAAGGAPAEGPAPALFLGRPWCPPGGLGPACTPVVPLEEGREAGAGAVGAAAAFALDVAAGTEGLAVRLQLAFARADPASLFVAARFNGLPPLSPTEAGTASSRAAVGRLPPFELAAWGPAAARAGADLPWCSFGRACFEIPYPSAGRLFVYATASGKWSATALFARGGCPRACSGRGRCAELKAASRGLLWQACACERPWGGPDCSLPSRSAAAHGLQAAVLAATNLAIAPAALAARRAGLPVEALAFGATGLCSALYHLCDSDLLCLGLPYASLQAFDILLATYDFALAGLLLAGLRGGPAPKFLLLLALAFVVFSDRFGPWPVLVGVVPALLHSAWRLSRERWRLRATLGQKGPRRLVLLGALCGTTAGALFPLETDGTYWLLHSLWHAGVMLTPYFVIRAAALASPPAEAEGAGAAPAAAAAAAAAAWIGHSNSDEAGAPLVGSADPEANSIP